MRGDFHSICVARRHFAHPKTPRQSHVKRAINANDIPGIDTIHGESTLVYGSAILRLFFPAFNFMKPNYGRWVCDALIRCRRRHRRPSRILRIAGDSRAHEMESRANRREVVGRDSAQCQCQLHSFAFYYNRNTTAAYHSVAFYGRQSTPSTTMRVCVHCGGEPCTIHVFGVCMGGAYRYQFERTLNSIGLGGKTLCTWNRIVFNVQSNVSNGN